MIMEKNNKKEEKRTKDKIKKTDKLFLIIDGDRDKRIDHELVRIDYREQLIFFSGFLQNFISNKKEIDLIIRRLKWNFKISTDYLSSYRIKDKLSTIDFCEFMNNKILFVFMVINKKRKIKSWSYERYFKSQ